MSISKKTAQSLKCIYCLLIAFFTTPSLTFSQNTFSFEKPLISKWQNNLQSMSLANFGDKVVMALPNGVIANIDPYDGHIIWKVNLGGDIVMQPLPDKTLFFINTANITQQETKNYHLQAIDINTGVTKWRISLSKPILKTYIEESSQFLLIILDDLTLIRLNRYTGEIIRTFGIPSSHNEVNYLDENFIVATSNETLSAINVEDSKVLWRLNLTNNTVIGIVKAGNSLIFATTGGYVYSLDKMSGRTKWKRKITNNITSVLKTDYGILITNAENKMYFCTLQGKTKWKKLIDGKFSNNVLIHNSSILLFPVGNNTGFVLSLKNGKLLNRIRLEELNFVIAPPVAAEKTLLIQTQKGLLAFGNN
jgi:outer membrane protein assembly factor BamB